MNNGKLKPIRIYWQFGVSIQQILFVKETLFRFLTLLKIDLAIDIYFGTWLRLTPYLEIKPGSIWHGQYNASTMLADFPAMRRVPDYKRHYNLLLTHSLIFSEETEWYKHRLAIYGLAQGDGAIICVNNPIVFANGPYTKYYVANTIIHELCHLFGLVDPTNRRPEQISRFPDGVSVHCAYRCIMYPVLREEVLFLDNPFCSICWDELQRIFFNLKK